MAFDKIEFVKASKKKTEKKQHETELTAGVMKKKIKSVLFNLLCVPVKALV